MRFLYPRSMHLIYLIFLILNYGKVGQCSMIERRPSSSSISTTSTSTSSSSSSSSSSSLSSSLPDPSSSSTRTSTSSSPSSSTSYTSTIVKILTATVEALPETPSSHDNPTSTPPLVAHDDPSNTSQGPGPAIEATLPWDGPETKTPIGSTTKPLEVTSSELLKAPGTQPGNGPSMDVSKGPHTKPWSKPHTESDNIQQTKSPYGPGTKPNDNTYAEPSPSSQDDGSKTTPGWPWEGKPDTITSPTTTTPSTTYTNAQITITSAPNWGDQEIPVNNCNFVAPGGDIEWNPCMVFAGTVQLSFFPENKGNLTYPSTYYDPALSLTLTSPSIYMVINTLTASNACGALGPTYKDYVISMDLTDVSTMQPFPDATARFRLGDPRQLTLNDLATNCPKSQDRPEDQTLIFSSGAIIDPHPIDDPWNRCNPRLVMPSAMKSVGLPYWRHCGNDNGRFGVFDPPIAVPPVQGLFPITTPVPVVPTTVPANPVPTVEPAPAPTTPPPVVTEAPAQPPYTETAPPAQDPPPEATTPVVAPAPPADTQPADPQPTPSLPDVPNSPTPTVPAPADPQTNAPINTPVPAPAPVPTEPSVIAIIGTNTISAVPGSVGVVLPDGASATVGAVTTLLDSNNAPVIVSVAPSGIIIQGTGTTQQFIANPTVAPAAPVGVPAPIATVGTHIIVAEPGATTLLVNGQTLTAGGALVTLEGTNNIATLGPAGLIVQYPSGLISTFTIPSAVPAATPTASGVVTAVIPPASEINGLPVSNLPGGSAVVVGTQTVSIGGPPVTIPVDTVITLAPPGLIIQKPGGIESTVSVVGFVAPSTTTAEMTTTTSARGGGLAGIIASIGGIAPPPSPPSVADTQSDTPTPTPSPTQASITWSILSSPSILNSPSPPFSLPPSQPSTINTLSAGGAAPTAEYTVLTLSPLPSSTDNSTSTNPSSSSTVPPVVFAGSSSKVALGSGLEWLWGCMLLVGWVGWG